MDGAGLRTWGGELRIRGVGEAIRKLASLSGAQFDAAVQQVSMAAAQETRTTAVKSIQTVSFGSYQLRRKQGGGRKPAAKNRFRVVSRPGSPPNTDTGALVRSIAAQRWGKTGARVGSSIAYAKWLENGTRGKNGGTLMAARPWLAPAADKTDVNAVAMKIIPEFLKRQLSK
jgi:phage gpG-like protein